MLNLQQPAMFAGPQAMMPVPVSVVPAAHRGTLQPGETLQVGEYKVTVERYLSEGGYAHVYVVRTERPIGGTTQHVLKRIACANNEVLKEVGQEVQVMKLLRGHPNIVQLHSASSLPLPDGSSVVFILMEFCPGGGIIDLLNRRLRTRLTEAEILQIFVDVCEAVARMHALKPPLLHRDLKIENILQAGENVFKLCDFGSAAAVAPHPPSNPVQLRLLEADLNKHTTLQYRAPEMVDVYQRRPIDTKSDVWALGVLLYKLCYYTTPFEAHGPVAILNASYKIPAYPVYSAELNALIGRMLQPLGPNRPSVFEVLSDVHRMRGTKSQFVYAVSPSPHSLPLLPSPSKTPLSPPPTTNGSLALPSRPPALRSHTSGPLPRTTTTLPSAPAPASSALAPTAPSKPAARSKPSSPHLYSMSPPVLPLLPGTSNTLSPPLAPIPTSTPKTRTGPSQISTTPTPAYPPRSTSSLSAEERFPSIEELSSTFERTFSPPAPGAQGRGTPSPLSPVSPGGVERPGGGLGLRVGGAGGGRASPVKVGVGAGSNGLAVRATGVQRNGFGPSMATSSTARATPTTTSAPTTRPAFTTRASSSSVPTTQAPFDPLSSQPSSQPQKNDGSKLPERAGPPLKRLESEFAKPRKKKGRRSTADDDEEAAGRGRVGEKEQPREEAKTERPTMRRDWLTGDGQADGLEAVRTKPLEPVKTPNLVLPSARSLSPSKSGPRTTVQPPTPQKPWALPAAAQKSWAPPSPTTTATAGPPPESPTRTSAFKRHSVAVPRQAYGVPASPTKTTAAAAVPQLPPRPRPASQIFSPSSPKSFSPTPTPLSPPPPRGEKPSYLRTTGTGTLKVDTSPARKKEGVSLSDNWSPIEEKERGRGRGRGSPSSDEGEGPEEVEGRGSAFRRPQPVQGQGQGQKRPEVAPKRIATATVTPATASWRPNTALSPRAAATRFPDLVSLDSGSKLPPSPPKPSSSPNIMDEENDELPAPLASSRVSAFLSRQTPLPTPSTPTAAPTPSRPRPQSMFMSSSMVQTMTSLQVPEDRTPAVVAERRTPRRGSISEMVSKYEALQQQPAGVSVGVVRRSPSKEVRAVSPKPAEKEKEKEKKDEFAGLGIAGAMGGSSSSLSRRRTVAHTPSQSLNSFGPSTSAVRLPGLAAQTTTAPQKSPALYQSGARSPGSRSPVVEGDYMSYGHGPRALPGLSKSPSAPASKSAFLATPSGRAQSPRPVSPGAKDTPQRRTPSPLSRPTQSPAPTSKPPPTRTSTLPPPAAQSQPAPPPPNVDTTSPRPPSSQESSPEQPFQGVGRLIDQWQKKAAEVAQPVRGAAGKTGVMWEGRK